MKKFSMTDFLDRKLNTHTSTNGARITELLAQHGLELVAKKLIDAPLYDWYGVMLTTKSNDKYQPDSAITEMVEYKDKYSAFEDAYFENEPVLLMRLVRTNANNRLVRPGYYIYQTRCYALFRIEKDFEAELRSFGTDLSSDVLL